MTYASKHDLIGVDIIKQADVVYVNPLSLWCRQNMSYEHVFFNFLGQKTTATYF